MLIDSILVAADTALRTLSGGARASRPLPRATAASEGMPDALAPDPSGADQLTLDERRLSGALMRVNHVGEVCAQALYQAQALTARDPVLKQTMMLAAREELDHLAWTRQRLDALGARPSWLNPLWYAGAFAFGLLAGRAGDRVSLGFVVETERQVERHLASHLERLPAADLESRALVEQMKQDESAHADRAEAAGALRLPRPVAWLMRGAAGVMTRTAHHI